MKNALYAQGDIIIECISDTPLKTIKPELAATSKQFVDPDNAVVLARGEVTGHRHRFMDLGVTMFRDDAIANGGDSNLKNLYLGNVNITGDGAELLHEEHNTIKLPPGQYIVRRQQEWTAEKARIVAD